MALKSLVVGGGKRIGQRMLYGAACDEEESPSKRQKGMSSADEDDVQGSP